MNNQEKVSIFELTPAELAERLEKIGEPSYRASQICAWLWKHRVFKPQEMTDLSKQLRGQLPQLFCFRVPEIVREERSKSDGTRKFLIRMTDGAAVETALLKQGDRLTACLSTQVGCPVGCPFCVTGAGGFERNLSAGEIAAQLAVLEKHLGRDINNVVLMGMGEPLLNTEAVLKAVAMLNDPKMRALGRRNITLSTAGIVPGIRALAASGLGIRLAVSLHAAEDELRDELVPCNTGYPLSELMAALREYQLATGDRVTIEYAMFRDRNDTIEHARKLVRLLHGLHAFINLIPANKNMGGFERSRPESILRFQSVLKSSGFESEIRMERGGDIGAACGQLGAQAAEGRPAPVASGPAERERTPREAKESRGGAGPRAAAREGRRDSRRPAGRDARRNAPGDAGGPRKPERPDRYKPAPRERTGPPSAGRDARRNAPGDAGGPRKPERPDRYKPAPRERTGPRGGEDERRRSGPRGGGEFRSPDGGSARGERRAQNPRHFAKDGPRPGKEQGKKPGGRPNGKSGGEHGGRKQPRKGR